MILTYLLATFPALPATPQVNCGLDEGVERAVLHHREAEPDSTRVAELSPNKALRVLIVASSLSAGKIDGGKPLVSAAADSAEIARQLRLMLERDEKITGTVEFENIYRSRIVSTAIGQRGEVHDLEYHCHSLVQYYFWPAEREERLKNLRGKGECAWNYVVLIGDPYLLTHVPGLYAEGAFLLAEEVNRGRAEPMLLVPPVHSESETTEEHLEEVIGRVGSSAGITIVPAARAWRIHRASTEDLGPEQAAYFAAACLYSQIRGKSAENVEQPASQALANLAHRTVQKKRLPVNRESAWAFPSPFAMVGVEKRSIEYGNTGTSSEAGIQRALAGVLQASGMNGVGYGGRARTKPAGPIDVNFGRGNRGSEPEKRYRPDPKLHTLSFGFPLQDNALTASLSMRYGLDWRTGLHQDDGTDLGVTTTMLREQLVSLGARCIPVRLLWAKLHDARPDLAPLSDQWHMASHLNEASAAFLSTLLTGRCPIGAAPESSDDESQVRWLSRKIGYETAWRMARLDSRAPGFRVLPTKREVVDLARGDKATLMVAFAGVPQSKVTVRVSVEGDGTARAMPRRLTFTPRNHGKPQRVTITGKGKRSEAAQITVVLETESRDQTFDALKATWKYAVHR